MRLSILFCLILLFVITITYIYKRQRYANNIKHLNICLPKLKKKYDKIRNDVIQKEPEIEELNKLIADFRYSKDYNNILKIGDFYRKGAYPRWKPNKQIAKKCYDLVEHSSLDTNLSTIAMCKYIEIMNDNLDHSDIQGMEISEIYYDKIEQLVNEDNLQTYQYNEIIFGDDIPHIPNNHIPNNQNNNQRLPEIPVEINIEPVTVFHNDLQNVHDHYLTNITKNNIDKLKKNFKYNDNLNIKDILLNEMYNDNLLNTEQRFKIGEVLEKFNNSYHTTFGITEIESLKYIYTFICKKPNKSDLLHNLMLQLEDCYENGIVVCPTGRISRIISLASDSDEFNSNRNIYYIKDELESLAFKVRNDELKKLSKEELDLYNNGDDDIADKLKQIYIEKVKEEYCNKLNINYDIIKPFIDVNVSGF